jgi:3-hydroxyacyl-CoA dehydrogenase/enoyl-CoA hydratase/3-hydroxybutyryl-CoA epimerase
VGEGQAVKNAAGTGSVDLKALADRMVAPALNEAVACLREGIVADGDLVDAGVIFGTGFAPHRGGPIATIPRARQARVAAHHAGSEGGARAALRAGYRVECDLSRGE